MNAPKIKKNDSAVATPTDDNVVVKKVRPYPISCQVIKAEGLPPIRGQILKLTEIGVLVKMTADHFFKVGDNCTISFDVPTTDKSLKESVKVIKTYHAYDQITDDKMQKTFTIELHFRSMKFENRTVIKDFNKKIGQQ